MAFDPTWIQHMVSGVNIAALLRLATQFTKNRNSGKIRDNEIRLVREQLSRLGDKVDMVAREVDKDRHATNELGFRLGDRLSKLERKFEPKVLQ